MRATGGIIGMYMIFLVVWQRAFALRLVTSISLQNSLCFGVRNRLQYVLLLVNVK